MAYQASSCSWAFASDAWDENAFVPLEGACLAFEGACLAWGAWVLLDAWEAPKVGVAPAWVGAEEPPETFGFETFDSGSAGVLDCAS